MRTLLLSFVLAAFPAYAGSSVVELRWLAFEKICDATFEIKGFKEKVRSGISFQLAARATQADLKVFTTSTCPKNWDKLNGQKSAQEIIPEFQRLSRNSIELKERAEKQAAEIAKIYDDISTGLKLVRVNFSSLKCGRALNSMVATYQNESAAIFRKYSEIQSSCPVLASKETIEKATAGAARTYGESGGNARFPSGAPKNGGSDLTGTEKAIDDQKKAKPVLDRK